MAYSKRLTGLAASVLVVLVVWLPTIGMTDTQSAGIHFGPVTTIGDGHARSFVQLGHDGQPIAIGIRMSALALKGLPLETPGHGRAWEYRLELPAEAAGKGYDHITIDWNPRGHMPPGVYDSAHFDFHFYVIDSQARDRITLQGEDLARAGRQPPPEFMPSGYVLPEGTAEQRMGAHAIDPGAPEFNGAPFTKTFIYGFHDGRMVFIEPMVTLAHLESKQDLTEAIAVPERYQAPGFYPTAYRVGFDAQTREHLVVLEGLQHARN